MSRIVKYKYEMDINTDVLFIIYLSQAYRIDLESLILLYDRIGKDLFYMFFLLSGKSIVMPKHTKFIKIRNFVDNVHTFIKKEDIIDNDDDVIDNEGDIGDFFDDEDNEDKKKDIFERLKTGEGLTRQEKTFFSFVNSVYNRSTNKIVIDCEIPECGSV